MAPFEWRSIKGIVAEFEKHVGVKAYKIRKEANVIAYGYMTVDETL